MFGIILLAHSSADASAEFKFRVKIRSSVQVARRKKVKTRKKIDGNQGGLITFMRKKVACECCVFSGATEYTGTVSTWGRGPGQLTWPLADAA